MKFLDTILNVIFPVHCLSCGKRSQNPQEARELCLACLLDSPSAERESAEWIFPIFDYRHPPIKKSIGLFKYKGKKRLAQVFAEAMYGHIIEELSELRVMRNFNDPILIPIPLSRKRYRERGYNQAELICKKLIEIDGQQKNFKLEKEVLLKIKETEHQANLKERHNRLKNLSGSFAIKNPGTIQGRNIILIDDVLTTGATLTEAKKTLKQSGAKKIIAFTIAH